jgi:hypothetical protein
MSALSAFGLFAVAAMLVLGAGVAARQTPTDEFLFCASGCAAA